MVDLVDASSGLKNDNEKINRIHILSFFFPVEDAQKVTEGCEQTYVKTATITERVPNGNP